jgi:hypothetical protein
MLKGHDRQSNLAVVRETSTVASVAIDGGGHVGFALKSSWHVGLDNSLIIVSSVNLHEIQAYWSG